MEDLPYDKIAITLRAADKLIKSDGRTMLAKVLKGSKEKKLLDLNLNKCPVYGFYRDYVYRCNNDRYIRN
ncbi:MAG: RQC domain-containing protein [Spirochaetota bacterium]|nr:RQC domain-containing protein [Spirochaetota bacterium]